MSLFVSSLSSLSSFSVSALAGCVSSGSSNDSSSKLSDGQASCLKRVEQTKDLRFCVASYAPTEAELLNKAWNLTSKKLYPKALKNFKKRIGSGAYFSIAAEAISDLKGIVPNAPRSISTNKSILTKRIFCNLFKTVKLLGGDGFLRELFRGENIDTASSVISHSVDADILEKIHRWIEDRNLIIMMRAVADSNALAIDQDLLTNIDNSSYDAVHTRAEALREWIQSHNDAVLGVTDLDLRAIGLSSIPSEIGFFVNLRELKLAHNKITRIAPEIGNLVNLQALRLSDNRITRIPPEMGNLVNLLAIDLIYNRITRIPPEMGNLVNLKAIDLSYNRITRIPPEMGNLVNLLAIHLSYNRITRIPPEMGNLVNLRTLHLSYNRITRIPPEVGSLVNLGNFDLLCNQITQVPDMTNFPQTVRFGILGAVPLRARVSYYLSAYLPSMQTIITSVSTFAFGCLMYYFQRPEEQGWA